MTGREFITRLRKLARVRGVEVRTVAARGKGSHITVNYGGGRTVVKDRKKALGVGLLTAMCKQLGPAGGPHPGRGALGRSRDAATFGPPAGPGQLAAASHPAAISRIDGTYLSHTFLDMGQICPL